MYPPPFVLQFEFVALILNPLDNISIASLVDSPKGSLANIFLMADVGKVCRITMDTDKEPCINVHRKDGTIMKFQQYGSGLYYYDASVNKRTNNTNEDVSTYCFVETVANNKKLFTRRELESAEQARQLYIKLGRPGQQLFESILSKNLIRNCPVTAEDAKRAAFIYGPELYSLKGKMVRGSSRALPSFVPIAVPDYILQHHKHVTLAMNFFYVQRIPFFHTKSRKIRLLTATQTSSRSKRNMLTELRRILQIYDHRGFKITNIIGDCEFECLREDIRPIELTTTAADEHVGDIERSIRTIKEGIRCIVQSLPYTRYTKLMINRLVTYVLRNKNQLPSSTGISDRMSPLGIVLGHPLPDYNNLQLEYGTYVQVFEDRKITNRTDSRCTGAIALSMNPSANGTYEFMSLHTGQLLRRKKFTILPITSAVINQVDKLASAEQQPLIVGALT